MAKTIKTRVLLKSDTNENWKKANNSFIPQKGEICIYLDRVQLEDGSYIPGIKVGDGINYINELEFINDDYITNAQIDSLFQPSIISFTVDGVSFSTKKNTTWSVFISENTSKGFSIGTEDPYAAEHYAVYNNRRIIGLDKGQNQVLEENWYAYLSSKIIANYNYTLIGGPSDEPN